VSKEDLLDSVWTDAIVSEGTLTNSIRELRAALGDDARSPKYIETVHRRGFRFVARLERVEPSPAETASPPSPATTTQPRGTAAVRAPVSAFVGRRSELDRLLRLASEAFAGSRRIVLVRGEAGIGKSTLVDRFTAALSRDPAHARVRVATGRAVGYLQGAPPFLPVLSAIEALATGADAAAIVASLAIHAPDLLQQMPWLSADAESRASKVGPIRRELGARLVDFFAELTAEQPLALVLEDLHDADAPTVGFLLSLLEHEPPLAMLVIGTYRPGEAVLAANGLATAAPAIAAHANGSVLDLDLLAASDVAEYLHQRDPSLWTEPLTALVHRQSGGNPLFMVTVADSVELLGPDGANIERISESLRALLAAQLRSLDFGQRELLASAAVVGVEFSSMAVAAAIGRGVDDVEDVCEELVKLSRFLKAAGVADWPSGSVGQAYAFRHELYRRALYGTLPVARRQVLHQRVGEALESGHTGATIEIAAELAEHFCLSGDDVRAVRYLRETAQLARQRYAYREAVDLLDRALTHLARQAEDDARDQMEFAVQTDRAVTVGALHANASPLLRETCERIAVLGARLPASFDRFVALLLVFGYRMGRSDIAGGTELADQMLQMAATLESPIALGIATIASAYAATTRGELARADRELRNVLAKLPRDVRPANLPAGVASGRLRDMVCPAQIAMSQNLCYLDRPDEAYQVARDTIVRSDWLDDQWERANARVSASKCAAVLGDRASALRWASEAVAICREHAIADLGSVAELLAAWADAEATFDDRRHRAARGIEQCCHLFDKGLFLGLVAEIEIEAGDLQAAASALAAARAFCDLTGSQRHSAELCRRTAWVEEQLGTGARGASVRARHWRAEARRIARAQGCRLVLRRLSEEH